MPRTTGGLGSCALAAACLAWAACDGPESRQGDEAQRPESRGPEAAESSEAGDFRGFAQSDSARDGGGPDAVRSGAAARVPAAGDSAVAGDGHAGAGSDSLSGSGGSFQSGASGDSLAQGVADAGPAPLVVAAGTRMRVRLDEEVSAEMHLPGHAVIATVAADVTGAGGALLVRSGAKLLGRVLASEPSPGPGEDAHLEIAFETLSADEFERPVEVVLAGGPPSLNPFGGFAEPRPYRGRLGAGAAVLVEVRAAFSVPAALAPAAAGEGEPSASVLGQADTLRRAGGADDAG